MSNLLIQNGYERKRTYRVQISIHSVRTLWKASFDISMRTSCFSIFNLAKRGAMVVPTKSYMAHNHEVNAKVSVHYRKNLRLSGEDMEHANVVPVVLLQTEDICEVLLDEHDFESTPR